MMCAQLEIEFKPQQLCNYGHFLPFFPGRKIAFLFSSLKSPFVILKVPGCLCFCRQLAATLLKIAGGGNRFTLSIKNRKGSTGVNNAWERVPLTQASRAWLLGRALQGRGHSGICFAPASVTGSPTNYSLPPGLPQVWMDEEAWNANQVSNL